MAFATLPELEARWPNKPPMIDEDQILAKLEDATFWLMSRYPTIPTDPDETMAGILRLIVCNMVRRAFNNADFEGMSRYSETAGNFAETMSFYSSGDNLYLTKQEIELIENALFGSGGAFAFETLG